MQQGHFSEVKDKLNRFSRRYYMDEFLRGLGIFASVSLLLLLIISTIEFISPNSTPTRAILWYAFLSLEIFGLIYLVAIPLFRANGRFNAKSQPEMARLVGQRMTDIRDRLLNVIQLEHMSAESDNGLLLAAIDQKSLDLARIPFHESASFRKGIGFLRLAGGVILLVALLSWTFPDVVNYGTKRIIYYESNIEPPAPFTFELESNDLRAVKHEALELKVNVKGSLIPREVYLEVSGQRIPVKKLGYNEFGHTFKHVREGFDFRLYGEGYYSKTYHVNVVERPSIRSFQIEVTYPQYLGLQPEVFQNQGNLTLPEGSKLTWEISTQEDASVVLQFREGNTEGTTKDGLASFERQINHSSPYSMWARNNELASDSINYMIEAVLDDFPKIDVSASDDTTGMIYGHLGRISDDHGLTQMKMGYSRKGDSRIEYMDIPISRGGTSQEFLYQIDWSTWNLSDGDGVEYFFEVWDNDGVHGRKSTKSQHFYFGLPDKEEIRQERENLSKNVEDEMKEALRDAKKLNKEIEELRKELLVEERKMDWEKKKKLEDVLQKREELMERVQQIKQQNELKNKLEDKLDRSEELLQKHNDLQELIEKLLDEETMKLLKELQERMEKMDKQEMDRSMEKLEMSNKDLEKQLDRSLELFKQLEFSQKVEETIEELDKNIQDQEELNEKLESGKEKPEDLAKEQEDINEAFKETEKKVEELKELNEGLENKHDVDDMEQKREEVKQSQENAKESLQKNQKKKAGDQQKKSSEGMNEMKKNLQSLQMNMQGQAMEDIQSLRNTLENLLELSFRQEALLEDMKGIRGDDPRFRELTMDQRSALDGMKVVEDSLNALAKRISQIQPTVYREVGETKRSMEKSLRYMTERKMGEVQLEQQLAMTSINNLAVLLDEIVQQLQNMMQSPSSGQCQKPGNSKPNAMSLQQLQKKLNQQLEEMQKMQEEGKKPGKQGEKGEVPAESLAKMAAEQARIREALRQLQEEAGHKDGQDMQKLGDMMEETEKDIVNRNITRETLLRQQKILTRLLESEKADKERDMDNKRESQSGIEKNKGNLLDLNEYYKARNSEHERLMKENVSYSRFYKEKVEEYFKTISE